jgi:hypothetical protein
MQDLKLAPDVDIWHSHKWYVWLPHLTLFEMSLSLTYTSQRGKQQAEEQEEAERRAKKDSSGEGKGRS